MKNLEKRGYQPSDNYGYQPENIINEGYQPSGNNSNDNNNNNNNNNVKPPKAKSAFR